jgi:hypothetical protein
MSLLGEEWEENFSTTTISSKENEEEENRTNPCSNKNFF